MADTFRKDFNSWNEFVDHCENGNTDMAQNERQSRTMPPDDLYDFAQVRSFKETLDLARNGWPEGLKKAKELSSSLFDHISSKIERVDVKHDIEGHSIDIARFVDGEPEAWLKFENVIQESESGHKLIRITFNFSVSGAVSKETIIRKGAAIVALIELLEYAGHRVELTLAMGTAESWSGRYGNPIVQLYTKIKDFDQNVDMSKLAYVLCHPSVLRSLYFSFAETMPDVYRRLTGVHRGGGYGSPADIPESERGDIHIGHSHAMDGQWQNPDLAEKWILKELQKQGIHLKKEN